MKTHANPQARVTQEALSGRLPVLGGERIYSSYASYLWTCVAFSAATWGFLVGGYLPFIGNTMAGITGYVVGMIIGMVPVTLAAGIATHKYGIETLDAAKAAFGRYGIVIPLVGLVATLVGWTYVVMALTARGAGNVVRQVRGTAETSEALVVVLAVATLAITWVVASKGPWMFERLSSYIGPGHLVLTAIMLAILIYKFGGDIFSLNVPAEQAFTADKQKGFTLAVEFGIANSLTWWPIMGGLTRLVKSQNQIVGPSVIGVGLFGAAFISGVAAMAGAAYGTADPTIWMIDLGGRVFGSMIMSVVLLANLATMVILIYLAGVSAQHVRVMAKMRWELVVAVMLLPGLIFAFQTEWLLAKVMTWLTYNGVLFVGITGIMLVDYYVLRRQHLDVPGIFSRSKEGPYWFWGGFNWVAVAVATGSVAFYLWLYNPVSLETQPIFRWFGAGLPTMAAAAAMYWLLMRLVIPSGVGGYARSSSDAKRRSDASDKSLNIGL